MRTPLRKNPSRSPPRTRRPHRNPPRPARRNNPPPRRLKRGPPRSPAKNSARSIRVPRRAAAPTTVQSVSPPPALFGAAHGFYIVAGVGFQHLFRLRVFQRL